MMFLRSIAEKPASVTLEAFCFQKRATMRFYRVVSSYPLHIGKGP